MFQSTKVTQKFLWNKNLAFVSLKIQTIYSSRFSFLAFVDLLWLLWWIVFWSPQKIISIDIILGYKADIHIRKIPQFWLTFSLLYCQRAIKKAKLTKTVSTIKLRWSDFSSAIKPSSTGPTKKPILEVAEINETPSAVLIPSTREAKRKISGTTTENPSPTVKNPSMETIGFNTNTNKNPSKPSKLA